MIVEKRFTIACDAETTLHPIVYESLDSEQGSTFTWPAAVLLAAYLAHIFSRLRGQRVIELGAGTGLPSFVCALCGASSVCITDRDGEDEIYGLLQRAVSANRATQCQLTPFPWGSSLPAGMVFDIILGADIFYNHEDFEAVMSTLSMLLDRQPNAQAFISYHNRSNRATIRHLLQRYEIDAEIIPLEAFLHPCHSLGVCQAMTEDARERSRGHMQTVPTFDDLHLLRLSKPP